MSMSKDKIIDRLTNENIELRIRLRNATALSNAKITTCTKKSVSAIVVIGEITDSEKQSIYEKLLASVKMKNIVYFFLRHGTEVQFLDENDLKRLGLYKLTDKQKYLLFS